jgi:hypothetical protein
LAITDRFADVVIDKTARVKTSLAGIFDMSNGGSDNLPQFQMFILIACLGSLHHVDMPNIPGRISRNVAWKTVDRCEESRWEGPKQSCRTTNPRWGDGS